MMKLIEKVEKQPWFSKKNFVNVVIKTHQGRIPPLLLQKSHKIGLLTFEYLHFRHKKSNFARTYFMSVSKLSPPKCTALCTSFVKSLGDLPEEMIEGIYNQKEFRYVGRKQDINPTTIDSEIPFM